jgi:c-di-GMP-binding flagellar brake protein YcgR
MSRESAMPENRKHPRVEEVAVITYEDISYGEELSDRLNEQPCWLRDVSEGGALLEVNNEVQAYTPILLHFNLECLDGDEAYLRVRGEVRWVTDTDGGPPYRVGVEFMEMDEDALETLRRFIAERSPTTG